MGSTPLSANSFLLRFQHSVKKSAIKNWHKKNIFDVIFLGGNENFWGGGRFDGICLLLFFSFSSFFLAGADSVTGVCFRSLSKVSGYSLGRKNDRSA